MRICQFKDVEPDMVLGKSLYGANGQLLLRAGFTLNSEIITQLSQNGISALYVMEEGTDDILPEELISEELRSKTTRTLAKTFESVGEAVSFRNIQPEKLKVYIEKGAEFKRVVDMGAVAGEITNIIDEILESGTFVLNQTLIKSHTGYNQEHALDTTLISLLMGRRLMFLRKDLVELGVGALLHDLGKTAMPSLLDKPPNQYTEEEQFLMREHPLFGQMLLANSSDRFFMAQAAIHYHHERQDGLGYPLGVKGKNKKPTPNGVNPSQSMYPLAEIIAVADAYDNLISGRYSDAISPIEAVTKIVRNSGTVYNKEVVKLLMECVAIFPTGSMVQIAECSVKSLEGSTGAVMKLTENRPHQPIVVILRDRNGRKITPKTVDLSAEQFARLEPSL